MTYKNLSQENLQKKRDYISTLSPADPDSLPTSQLDLIDDIITTSEELVALHFLINWLNTTKADVDYTYVVPLNFSKTLQGQHDYNNGKQTLEPDFLFNNTKGVDLLKENFKGQHSTFHLDQVTVNDHMKLLKKCFELLRSGDYIEAYKTLSNNNMGWRAVTLSGGLPFHDFKIYDQRDQVSCRREAELEKKRRFLLDFMQTKEWSDTLEARDNFYPIVIFLINLIIES